MGGICSKRQNQTSESTKKSKPSSKPLADESGGVTANENPLQTAAMPKAVTSIQPEMQPELYTPEAERYFEQSGRTEEYKRTFTAYYTRLCDALCAPIAQILPELAERTSIEKAQALLNKYIFRGISAGCPEVLEKLLFVMWHCSDHTCKALSEEMYLKLNISPSRSPTRKYIVIH